MPKISRDKKPVRHNPLEDQILQVDTVVKDKRTKLLSSQKLTNGNMKDSIEQYGLLDTKMSLMVLEAVDEHDMEEADELNLSAVDLTGAVD